MVVSCWNVWPMKLLAEGVTNQSTCRDFPSTFSLQATVNESCQHSGCCIGTGGDGEGVDHVPTGSTSLRSIDFWRHRVRVMRELLETA